MCHQSLVGVLKDSTEDECSNNYDSDDELEPDFEACDVYDDITCDDLVLLDPRDMEAGLWTDQDVSDYQAEAGYPDLTRNSTSRCVVKLHGWIYDLGATNWFDNSEPFYLKHGNGWFPQEILWHCGGDMTEPFDAVQDRLSTICAPDHKLGALNVVLGYLIGAVKDGPNDRCANDKPNACDRWNNAYSVERDLKRYSRTSWKSEATNDGNQCPVLLFDKVYDMTGKLAKQTGASSCMGVALSNITIMLFFLILFLISEFKPRHWGGQGNIGCGSDLTKKCTYRVCSPKNKERRFFQTHSYIVSFYKMSFLIPTSLDERRASHIPEIHVASLDGLQRGIIQDGITDPCAPIGVYDETRDF